MSETELPLRYRQILDDLKGQLSVCSQTGLKRQSPMFIETFAATYLRCLSSLARLRANPQWHRMLQPYQRLLVQAHAILYPEEGASWRDVWRWLWGALPAQLWQNRYFYLASLGICLVTAILGFVLVLGNFELASMFIPPFLRQSHELEAYLFSPSTQQEMLTYCRDLSVEAKSAFATFLFLNNAKVALLCFLSGFLYGIPTFLILVQTGLMLGTLPALFYHGDFIGIWAWLLPHGVPEVSAIIFAGGAGLRLGLTLLHPGEEPLGIALKRRIKSIAGTVLVFVLLLIWAAIVESFVRQSELSNGTRFAIAGFSLIPLGLLMLRAYFAARSLLPEKSGSSLVLGWK